MRPLFLFETLEAAKTYIYTIFAIKDNKVSDAEVAALAQAWGISTREAGMYLDFISKLRDDGKISDSDLQTLMNTWKLTKCAESSPRSYPSVFD